MVGDIIVDSRATSPGNPQIARHFSIRGVYDRSIGMPNRETLKRTLRHTCGFKLANDGQDTPALPYYLGHRRFSTW